MTDDDDDQNHTDCDLVIQSVKLDNAKVLADLNSKLAHLSPNHRTELSAVIKEFDCIFPDVPGNVM